MSEDEHKRMTEAGYSLIEAGVADHGLMVTEVRIASDGYGIWIRTRDVRHQPDRSGTCRHARQVQQKWAVDAETGKAGACIEQPEEYTCGYLDQFKLPPAVERWVHGLEIRSGDCERCPLYETPELPEALKGEISR